MNFTCLENSFTCRHSSAISCGMLASTGRAKGNWIPVAYSPVGLSARLLHRLPSPQAGQQRWQHDVTRTCTRVQHWCSRFHACADRVPFHLEDCLGRLVLHYPTFCKFNASISTWNSHWDGMIQLPKKGCAERKPTLMWDDLILMRHKFTEASTIPVPCALASRSLMLWWQKRWRQKMDWN